MKTLKNEIVEALRKASGTASKYAKQYDKFALSYHEYMDQSIEFENIASKVESACCENCNKVSDCVAYLVMGQDAKDFGCFSYKAKETNHE